MVAMKYKDKAELMANNTNKYVLRDGLAGHSLLLNNSWRPFSSR